ncbi:MAG: sugar phosphorylase [Chloroflexi bacterium HGW-Chloroflexi-3]|nr:MAG: sugar phosphorylase [Chloroflexi bacterium HGW-Chloroflexi-3]
MELKYQRINDLVIYLFGDSEGEKVFDRLKVLLSEFPKQEKEDKFEAKQFFKLEDIILITYGNSIYQNNQKPLETLFIFFQKHLQKFINTVHILPFYPYSSDDGFSVIDYLAVNPDLGSWDDINRFQSNGIQLMFDAVINHISSKSKWFEQFLQDDSKYSNYFISIEPDTDLSKVTRPRTSPLLTCSKTKNCKKWVWTTFSSDQIDLNYRNPDTLIDVVEIILKYILSGAKLIRLDAIAYLWKEVGTSCIHLPQTHAVVQLLRAILDEVAPEVLIITETNVPHDENLSYFGNGNNEAHLVYQFSLPPLLAHAILTGSAENLSHWASTLNLPSCTTTFFNFTASHDGVGIRPLMGILPPEEIQLLVDKTLLHGGKISSKANTDGSSSPYELNITYFDLINNPNLGESIDIQVKRFLVSQAIPLVLTGIPGIYIHSLLGSRNHLQEVEETGIARSINRQKLDVSIIENEISDINSIRYQILSGYKKLIMCRIRENAFHPNGHQKILHLSPAIFAVLRISPDGTEIILALQNVTNQWQSVTFSQDCFGTVPPKSLVDVLTRRNFISQEKMVIFMNPYEIIWLKSQ